MADESEWFRGLIAAAFYGSYMKTIERLSLNKTGSNRVIFQVDDKNMALKG